MPLYDYKCRSCGKVQEVRHGFKETFEDACSACGGEMARVFNAAGIVFKGSGFYINDSRKGSESASGSGSSASSSGNSSETPSAAPAATTPAAPASTPAKSDTAA